MAVEFDEGAVFHRHVCDECGSIVEEECDLTECEADDEVFCETCEKEVAEDARETTEPETPSE